jgi:alkaline phosphatase D
VITVSRRDFLALGASAVAVAPLARAVPVRSPRAPEPSSPFALGVTAGDPDETSAVLWTRLAGPLSGPDSSAVLADEVTVAWELADDAGFATVVDSGEMVALAAEGHSVHAVVELDGPRFYRFRAGDWTSPVGAVWPAPAASASTVPSELRIAAASCQHFETGFYAAHRDIAGWAPDLVLFLGDFIYEYGGRPVGGEVVRSMTGDEVQSIDDYRARYAQYLGDADLQASRAACPWVVIWDDHEVENNYAGVAPEHIADMPTFAARRLVAYQAWWEHMPVRMTRPESIDDITIYRTIGWGGLADLIMLDGRKYRTNQACNDVVLSLDPPCPVAAEPARTMLGADQEQWLADQLAATTAIWPVIGQQTVLSDVRLNGAVLNYDQWDGYGPARDRLLESARVAPRTIVLTGDIHLAGVGLLPGVGIEFVTTSISSGGLVPADLEDVVGTIGDIRAVELAHRGYTRHVVTPETWTAEFRIVDDAADPASTVSTWRTYVVDAATRDVVTPL